MGHNPLQFIWELPFIGMQLCGLTFPPLPPAMRTILEDGGLVAHIKKHGDFQLG